ncbi:hypothetical protein [Arthrobacter alpinus]|uniref:hypothetical protein n=1 Tax=Arthrobacter alpinus TaxID=656366 RepID=UPI001EF65917|nr:hypothetical protein [Arthrobacter alpinus]
MNAEPPLQRAFDHPGPDSGVISPVNNTQDLSGIDINDCRHPRFNPFPAVGLWIFEESDGAEAVFINTEHPRP